MTARIVPSAAPSLSEKCVARRLWRDRPSLHCGGKAIIYIKRMIIVNRYWNGYSWDILRVVV
jgi:hypothetical protein